MRRRRARNTARAFVLAGLLLGSGAALAWSWYAARFSPVEVVRPIAEKYADRFGLEPALVVAVIRAESGGDASAVSPAGAVGLMQLMPDTARAVAVRLKEPPPAPSMLLDPDTNIRYGCCYLARLTEQFGAVPEVLFAAYNAGPTRVYRWLAANQDRDAVSVVTSCPYPETRLFIRRAMRFLEEERERYRRLKDG